MTIPSPEFLEAASRLDQGPPPASPAPAPHQSEIDGELLWQALGTVIDPEIGLDLVTLGLVYDVEVIENAVRVTYTLTTPGCPMVDVISQGIEAAAYSVAGVEHVLLDLVWEPRWNPSMIREGAW
jgi:metal-sulfur cluster biosynthetic enzyme